MKQIFITLTALASCTAFLSASQTGTSTGASVGASMMRHEPLSAEEAQKLPRLRYGLLTLHNTLNEPINVHMETYINAHDPERNIQITNGTKRAIGKTIIAAQTSQALQTYPFPVMDKDTQKILHVFGGYVLLKLKRQTEENAAEYNGRVEEPGTYAISLDTAGQLALDKAATTTETKINQ